MCVRRGGDCSSSSSSNNVRARLSGSRCERCNHCFNDGRVDARQLVGPIDRIKGLGYGDNTTVRRKTYNKNAYYCDIKRMCGDFPSARCRNQRRIQGVREW